ncbi:hypothetical protein PC9H_006971 [Pleurotus ostreatus]|uniref:Uncharacterized protein n=1 Tax=Pleurotus ostreatus TaxID=5322 RepID=A0A8H6ZV51_PLEOS|nr:uncharacterized protein PC9H_006971 [Pleurotus ostreatus]KAF7431249.1 hypothetical protein PC9H_006971 [Pleurotus ostreatus]
MQGPYLLSLPPLFAPRKAYINHPRTTSALQQPFSHSPVASSSFITRLYLPPPLTMRVAILVLAFAAVFVLASPHADKKKGKKSKKVAAAAPEAPAADAAAAEPVADGADGSA